MLPTSSPAKQTGTQLPEKQRLPDTLRPEDFKVIGEEPPPDGDHQRIEQRRPPPTHKFTTKIEKGVNEAETINKILDQKVSLTFRNVLALSQPARQVVQNMTRVKREPVTVLNEEEFRKSGRVQAIGSRYKGDSDTDSKVEELQHPFIRFRLRFIHFRLCFICFRLHFIRFHLHFIPFYLHYACSNSVSFFIDPTIHREHYLDGRFLWIGLNLEISLGP